MIKKRNVIEGIIYTLMLGTLIIVARDNGELRKKLVQKEALNNESITEKQIPMKVSHTAKCIVKQNETKDTKQVPSSVLVKANPDEELEASEDVYLTVKYVDGNDKCTGYYRFMFTSTTREYDKLMLENNIDTALTCHRYKGDLVKVVDEHPEDNVLRKTNNVRPIVAPVHVSDERKNVKPIFYEEVQLKVKSL